MPSPLRGLVGQSVHPHEFEDLRHPVSQGFLELLALSMALPNVAEPRDRGGPVALGLEDGAREQARLVAHAVHVEVEAVAEAWYAFPPKLFPPYKLCSR